MLLSATTSQWSTYFYSKCIWNVGVKTEPTVSGVSHVSSHWRYYCMYVQSNLLGRCIIIAASFAAIFNIEKVCSMKWFSMKMVIFSWSGMLIKKSCLVPAHCAPPLREKLGCCTVNSRSQRALCKSKVEGWFRSFILGEPSVTMREEEVDHQAH